MSADTERARVDRARRRAAREVPGPGRCRSGRVPRDPVRPRARVGALRRGLRWARRGRGPADDRSTPDFVMRVRRPVSATTWRCIRVRSRSTARARRSSDRASSARSSPARSTGVSSSASPAPGPTSPGSRPWRCATATSGSSTGRRSGRAARSARVGRSSSPAPIPTSRSTAASPSSCATWSSPASRSARCARPTAARTSTRSS